MDKHLTAEQLAQYAEYLQSNKAMHIDEEILEHIANCDDCAAEAIEFSFISQEIEQSARKNINKDTGLRFKKIIYGIAAILIAIAVFALVIKISVTETRIIKPAVSNNKIVRDSVNPHDSFPQSNTDLITTNIKDKEMIAENFETDPTTEQLIANLKGNTRSDELEILTPSELKIKLSQPIILKWDNNQNLKLYISVYNNNLNEIESEETNDDNYTIQNITSPGLYYWKLFNEEYDLLFCGKIILSP